MTGSDEFLHMIATAKRGNLRFPLWNARTVRPAEFKFKRVSGRRRRSESEHCGSNSAVECNLAKVEVEGSSPFSRYFSERLDNKPVACWREENG